MKKFAVLVAVFALFAVAAPTFAATNPFMDVPMNSWAYDAVTSLAAKGILSGYPDGLYKGKQAMTRYEAASAVARALAYIDMTKADKQDVEMLKRLVVEFKDELDALGVRVDALEKDMDVFKKRLGGWRLSGVMRVDANYGSAERGDNDVSQSSFALSRARLFIERWFGENEDMYFYARINASGGSEGGDQNLAWRRFFVTIPIFYDMKLTAGRFSWNLDKSFAYVTSGPGRYDTGAWVTDSEQDGFGLQKNFGIGSFRAYVAQGVKLAGTPDTTLAGLTPRAWDLSAAFDFAPTENITFNIGGQYLKYDNDFGKNVLGAQYWDHITTGWANVGFKFMEGLVFNAAAYFQGVGTENGYSVSGNGVTVKEDDLGGTSFRLALDVKQDLLKFTSLYLGYTSVPQGFFLRSNGLNNIYVADSDPYDGGHGLGLNQRFSLADISVFTVGANQQWNDKWSTWLYYEQGKHDWNTIGVSNSTIRGYGIGVEYAHNANTYFGLNYQHLGVTDGYGDGDKVSRIRFSTEVTF